MRLGAVLTFALAALTAMTACSSNEDESGAPGPACPRAFIIDGASRVAVPAPTVTEDPQALRYVAALSDIRSECRHDDSAIEVDVGFNLLAQRGPALEGDRVNLTYFVATIGPDQAILGKQTFTAEVRFPEERPVAGTFEALTLRIPVASTDAETLPQLYVGFQLDPAELRGIPSPLPE
jgi:hypothetical protein